MSNESAELAIDRIYENGDEYETHERVEDYHRRHGIQSLAILTITSAYAATREVDRFWQKIRGKVVIEIGAGSGFLALEMAKFAKQVYAIEVDPAWSAVFAEHLYELKPANLTWIFGAAETVTPFLRGDIAVIYTRSAKEHMYGLALKMCPELVTGPTLELDELYPEIPPEIRAVAQLFAEGVTINDLKGRRGIGMPK